MFLKSQMYMEGIGMVTYEEIAKMIDHSMLKPEMTDEERYKFADDASPESLKKLIKKDIDK